VCAEWRDYRHFKAWADASGYSEGLTIDRIDNDKGYAPSNCRWATRKEQQNNRRCCVYIEHGGQRMTVTQWSETLGVPRHTVRKHLKAMNGGQ
jgi:response regulator of citrate/malate metabolism